MEKVQKITAGLDPPNRWIRPDTRNWRRGRDSNPRDDSSPSTHFPGVRLQPLGHPSFVPARLAKQREAGNKAALQHP
jgi:hypothetical protein